MALSNVLRMFGLGALGRGEAVQPGAPAAPASATALSYAPGSEELRAWRLAMQDPHRTNSFSAGSPEWLAFVEARRGGGAAAPAGPPTPSNRNDPPPPVPFSFTSPEHRARWQANYDAWQTRNGGISQQQWHRQNPYDPVEHEAQLDQMRPGWRTEFPQTPGALAVPQPGGPPERWAPEPGRQTTPEDYLYTMPDGRQVPWIPFINPYEQHQIQAGGQTPLSAFGGFGLRTPAGRSSSSYTGRQSPTPYPGFGSSPTPYPGWR